MKEIEISDYSFQRLKNINGFINKTEVIKTNIGYKFFITNESYRRLKNINANIELALRALFK